VAGVTGVEGVDFVDNVDATRVVASKHSNYHHKFKSLLAMTRKLEVFIS